MTHIVSMNIIEILCKYNAVLTKTFLDRNLMNAMRLQTPSFPDSVVMTAKKYKLLFSLGLSRLKMEITLFLCFYSGLKNLL